MSRRIRPGALHNAGLAEPHCAFGLSTLLPTWRTLRAFAALGCLCRLFKGARHALAASTSGHQPGTSRNLRRRLPRSRRCFGYLHGRRRPADFRTRTQHHAVVVTHPSAGPVRRWHRGCKRPGPPGTADWQPAAGTSQRGHRRPGLGTQLDGQLPAHALRPAPVDRAELARRPRA
ncbi:hypothetical protein D9M71_351510 [compost metagenome]